ncbi:MAG: hypothetical protein Q8R39_00620 [bacterium]|nr:hypothetical protein [bacterium]MDZ4284933.1 hypothetical protein [Patescibacteria group bacterium]
MNEHTEDTLVYLAIKSTNRGFLSRYLSCLFWIGVSVCLALLLEQHANATYAALDVPTREAFAALPRTIKKPWFLYPVPLLYGGIKVLVVVAAFFAVRILYTLLYCARERCTFFKSEGQWRVVEQVRYLYFFGRSMSHTHFDRIIDVTIGQNRLGLDRLSDTGTLDVVFVTAVGRGVVEYGVRIRAVHRPDYYKRRLVAPDRAYSDLFLAPRIHADAASANT